MDDEGYPALEESDLIKLDNGELTDRQIHLMIINGIKRNEERIDILFKRRHIGN